MYPWRSNLEYEQCLVLCGSPESNSETDIERQRKPSRKLEYIKCKCKCNDDEESVLISTADSKTVSAQLPYIYGERRSSRRKACLFIVMLSLFLAII